MNVFVSIRRRTNGANLLNHQLISVDEKDQRFRPSRRAIGRTHYGFGFATESISTVLCVLSDSESEVPRFLRGLTWTEYRNWPESRGLDRAGSNRTPMKGPIECSAGAVSGPGYSGRQMSFVARQGRIELRVPVILALGGKQVNTQWRVPPSPAQTRPKRTRSHGVFAGWRSPPRAGWPSTVVRVSSAARLRA
jgi:hypothetical protein